MYGKVRRCDNDIIYCSVEFEDGYKSYYYISDDDTIEVGDFVLVPAGKDNHEAVVEVVKKEYFAEEDVPFPMAKQNTLSENVRMLILTFRTMSLFDFLMTTKKSTSHDALRIVLVDFFCKEIKN